MNPILSYFYQLLVVLNCYCCHGYVYLLFIGCQLIFLSAVSCSQLIFCHGHVYLLSSGSLCQVIFAHLKFIIHTQLMPIYACKAFDEVFSMVWVYRAQLQTRESYCSFQPFLFLDFELATQICRLQIPRWDTWHIWIGEEKRITACMMISINCIQQ